MALVLLIEVIVVGVLVWLVLTRGLERALPFFAFVVVLVPWQCKVVLPGFFDLPTQRIALITLLGLYILTRMGKPRLYPARPVPLKALMLLSIGWLLVSTAHSIVPTMSLKAVIAQAIQYYLMYIILVRTISSKETIHRILLGIVAALMVCAVLGVGEAKFGLHVNDWFPKGVSIFGAGYVPGPTVGFSRGIRIETTFPHPIHYGAALALAIPLAFYLISVSKNMFHRVLLWAAIPLMFYNILMTGSRGPWLALGLSLAGVFLLCRGKLRWYLPAIAFLGLFMLMARSSMRERLIRVYDATLNSNTSLGSSFDYRFALINAAEHALAENTGRAVWGYGPGSSRSIGLKGPFLGDPEFPFISVDSTWLLFILETGYVGFAILALLLLTPAFMAFRDYLRFRKPAATLSGVLLVNLMAFYFMMISVALYDWAQIGFLLWILIALSLAHRRVVRHSRSAVVDDFDAVSDFALREPQPLIYCATPVNCSDREQGAIEENRSGEGHWTTEEI